jgi:hypothetical protein
MKKIIFSILILTVILFASSCQKWIDVNRNPNGPEKVTAYLYLSSMQQNFALATQYDSRMINYYTQNFAYYSSNYVYDLQGTPAWTSDMDEMWRTVYWKFGINLSDMISISEKEQRWDLAGIGYVLRAWGWQQLTDMHGQIVLNEAYQPGLYSFNYDNEQAVYTEVVRLLLKGIENLNKTDGSVSASFAGKGDQIYKGDRIKWKRLAYGLLAINMSHLSNKTALYKPDQVMSYVDSSFVSNADNALISFAGSVSADASFAGPMRGNFLGARPSKFVTNLMDGTIFGTGIVDPRMKVMLPPSKNILDKVTGAAYIGLDEGRGYSPISVNDQPINVYGVSGVGTAPTGTVGTYIFTNNVKWPLMTYSELQFIKAEAAFRKGDKTSALTAYTNGIGSAIDFTNTYGGAFNYTYSSTAYTVNQTVATAEKMAYVNAVVPVSTATLTLSKIMCQKYIHLWAWAPYETWTDIRRYHYTDTYPGESTQVFAGLTLPALASENNGNVIYRIRPRYNSEYVWNSASLAKIGGLKLDYHTLPIWITLPE